MQKHFEAFPKSDANYVPLSPLSFVTRTADLFPDRTAIIYGDRRYSWAESYARMRQLASALDGAGLGIGDTVSVIAANTPEMFEAHYGVPMAGCVLNTINTRLEAETIAYILDNSDCRLLIVDTAFHETVVVALASLDPVVRDRIKVVDIRDLQAGDMPHIGDQDYEAFIGAGDPAYDWQMPADEWQAGRRALSIITAGLISTVWELQLGCRCRSIQPISTSYQCSIAMAGAMHGR